jgi:hypothetical protein
VIITDINGNKMKLDGATASIQHVSYEHHEIHAGSHYFYEGYTELDDTDTADFGVQTPDTTKWTHLVWEILAQAQVTFEIYEGADIAFDGTDLTAYNNNRNSSNTSNWENFQMDPTVNSTGTKIAETLVGDATSPNRGLPGGGQRDRELVLKQNTIYLFRITSAANANVVSYMAQWYEHTNVA